MRASLIVTTYNWKEALNLVLLSAARQVVPPDELLVADDGSRDDTRELIRSHQRRMPFPIRHIWQKDDGFRAGRVRNLGIAAAQGEYIILLDGDMVLHPNFIADHIGCSIPNTFVQGSRVLIGPKKTDRMLTEEIIDVGFFTRGIDRRRHTIRNRLLSRLLSAESMSTRSIKSCNQGFWRDDLIRVNGFNEDMTGWGREDNELGVRILNSGVKRRTLKFQALAYHLHHTRTLRARLSINDEILAATVAEKKTRCENGLEKHLAAPTQVPWP